MALTKEKKQEVVSQVSALLSDSIVTVIANYQGTSVKDMQELRRQSQDSGTKVQVIKNRLLVKALESIDKFKGVDTTALKGQLLYAFNAKDEAAPAQVLAQFAKTRPGLQFVGAFSADGTFLQADDVKVLASLPGKDQLRSQLAGTIAGPLSGFVNTLSSSVRGVLNVLNARAEAIK